MPNSAPLLSPLARPGYLVGGKYKLESVIGYGGVGSVWRARHVNLGQCVAVKVIASAFSMSSDARRRFDMEAKAAAVLRSRHAVQVFDNGEFEDGTPYIVMEHLEGESLDRRIHRGGPLSIDETARVLTHIGRALCSAHQAGIVHRDIKPENIFLTVSHEEEDFIAKVLDFGIAKVNAAQHSTDTTRTGSMIGTPQYMSPEQARGSKEVDFRSDLYSLGALTYTMLTGNLVFEADTLGEMVLKVCGDPLPNISGAAPWVPADVDDWFQKACARDASRRFLSVTDMVDAFHVAAGLARPKRAPQPSRPELDPEIMIRTVVSDTDCDATGQIRRARVAVKQGNPFAQPAAAARPIVKAYDSSPRQSVTPPPSSSTLASARVVPPGAGQPQAALDQDRGINWGIVLVTVLAAGGAAMLAITFLGAPRLRSSTAAPSSASPPSEMTTTPQAPLPSVSMAAPTPPPAVSSSDELHPTHPPAAAVPPKRVPVAAVSAQPAKPEATTPNGPAVPAAAPEFTGPKPSSSALNERF